MCVCQPALLSIPVPHITRSVTHCPNVSASVPYAPHVPSLLPSRLTRFLLPSTFRLRFSARRAVDAVHNGIHHDFRIRNVPLRAGLAVIAVPRLPLGRRAVETRQRRARSTPPWALEREHMCRPVVRCHLARSRHGFVRHLGYDRVSACSCKGRFTPYFWAYAGRLASSP